MALLDCKVQLRSLLLYFKGTLATELSLLHYYYYGALQTRVETQLTFELPFVLLYFTFGFTE